MVRQQYVLLYCLLVSVQPGKLAYSAHDYGPYVAPLFWFYNSTFPDNLIPLMRKNWGKVIEKGIAPVWVGEFGSFYPPNDSDLNYRERATFEQQIKYIGQVRELGLHTSLVQSA